MDEQRPFISLGEVRDWTRLAASIARLEGKDERETRPEYREMQRLLEYLERAHPEWGEAEIALRIARICCPQELKRRHRP